jgi:hypothetical protein
MVWALPIGPCRERPSFLPANPSISCFVRASLPRWSTALRLAAPSMKLIPMAATGYFRSWRLRSGLKKGLICASILLTRPASRSAASRYPTALSTR